MDEPADAESIKKSFYPRGFHLAIIRAHDAWECKTKDQDQIKFIAS